MVRALSCWLGVLERADGSAQLDVENTKVITAVHGPLVVGGKREHPERAVVEVIFKPCSGIAGVPLSLPSPKRPCGFFHACRRLASLCLIGGSRGTTAPLCMRESACFL